jgi:predicted TIM-barrel enzyme
VGVCSLDTCPQHAFDAAAIAKIIDRACREAVEAVLRAADEMYAVALVARMADRLDRLAGRPVGTTLARVRDSHAE